jgi:hypothetical protein
MFLADSWAWPKGGLLWHLGTVISNQCTAENQVAFCYKLLMMGNDKLWMFSSLYAQKKIALADCVHAFLLLPRDRTYFTFITRPHCGQSIGTACVPSGDFTNTMQRGWGGGGGGAGLPPQRPECNSKSVHVEFVVDKVALARVSLLLLLLSPACIIPPVVVTYFSLSCPGGVKIFSSPDRPWGASLWVPFFFPG